MGCSRTGCGASNVYFKFILMCILMSILMFKVYLMLVLMPKAPYIYAYRYCVGPMTTHCGSGLSKRLRPPHSSGPDLEAHVRRKDLVWGPRGSGVSLVVVGQLMH